MPTVFTSIDGALKDIANARKLISKISSSQVRGVDEVAALKSMAYAWFHTRRQVVAEGMTEHDIVVVDDNFKEILTLTDKHAAKNSYLTVLKKAKDALLLLRSAALTASSTDIRTDDLAPDFSPLVGNCEMREILARRWDECRKCVNANAHLAAVVMMGGLLEALFVAKANQMPDKALLVRARAAPKHKETGKALNYQDWMLDSYIKVGRELKWITESASDVADILKEYRNYIHPEKERRHGIVLTLNDSSMFWQITKILTRQLLMSSQ